MTTPQSGTAPALEVSGVSKQFGQLMAVSEVSFTVAEGETLGVAGPNGAGKSTMFNLLTGVPFGPDSGRVVLYGTELAGKSPQAICRAGLARTFQTEAVFDSLTVAENVRVSSRYAGKRHRDASGLDEVLDRVGLVGQRRRVAAELSLFDRKRLMIANALVGGPRMLLMDEPASGLNPEEQDQLVDLIVELKSQGLTMIVIEHVLSVLRRVADRILVLAGGEVLIEGNPTTVLTSPEVITAYLGEKAARA